MKSSAGDSTFEQVAHCRLPSTQNWIDRNAETSDEKRQTLPGLV